MAVSPTPTYPTSVDGDVVPGVRENDTLDAADHTNLHRRTHNSVVAVQTLVGLEGDFLLRNNRSVLRVLNDFDLAINALQQGSTITELTDVTITNPILINPRQDKLYIWKSPTEWFSGSLDQPGKTTLVSSNGLQIMASGSIIYQGPLRNSSLGPSKDNPGLRIVQASASWKVYPYEGAVEGDVSLGLSYNRNLGISTLTVRGMYEVTSIPGQPDTGQVLVARNAAKDLEVTPLQQVQVLLSNKQNKPPSGYGYLTFNPEYQSEYAVTNWGARHNIQLQWVLPPYTEQETGTVRAHIDAPGGGMPGVRWFDLAKSATKDPWVYKMDTAVMASSPYNITLNALSANGGVQIGVDFNWIGTLSILAPSSSRFKNAISELSTEKCVQFFEEVPAVSFQYTNDTNPAHKDSVGSSIAGTVHAGFIAEDAERAMSLVGLPSGMVTSHRDEDTGARVLDGVETRDLLAVLWQVVKHQSERITALGG